MWKPLHSSLTRSRIILLFLILLCSRLPRGCQGLRCYVCGGHSGRPCEDIRWVYVGPGKKTTGLSQSKKVSFYWWSDFCFLFVRESTRRSPYVRPSPVPASDGSRQWEVCNDIINNRGCMKQVVNNGTCHFLMSSMLTHTKLKKLKRNVRQNSSSR